MRSSISLVLCLFFGCFGDDSAPPVTGKLSEEGRPNYQGENVMKYEPPELSEEESHSQRLPSTLLCDGCLAVAFQVSNRMMAFHNKRYKNSKAPESAIIELMEEVCKPEVFQDYGVKPMNGQNRISGPGLEANQEPGMMMGGGRWPNRIATMCGEFLGEVDEYEIYEHILENVSDPDALSKFLCENEEGVILNSCGESKKEQKTKKDQNDKQKVQDKKQQQEKEEL